MKQNKTRHRCALNTNCGSPPTQQGMTIKINATTTISFNIHHYSNMVDIKPKAVLLGNVAHRTFSLR